MVLYHNKLTGKVNSIHLSNVIRWFCSNKPIVVVLEQVDDTIKTVNIQQDTYMMFSVNSKQLYTYIHKGTEHLKTTRTADLTNQKAMVLTANNNFVFSKIH